MRSEWYALKTRSRHEVKVDYRLKKKSFETFFPQVEAWSMRKDRKKKIQKPLFPGYLFVKCLMTKNAWLEILKTYGVVNLLSQANKPSLVPEEQINSIKTVLTADLPVKPHPFLKAGDKVVVTGGSLKGAVGIYESYNHQKGKLVISIDLLSRAIEVEIDSFYIEAY